jgi:hypothetical protein
MTGGGGGVKGWGVGAAALSSIGMPQASQKRAPGSSSLSQWGHFTAVPSFLLVGVGFFEIYR